MNMHEELRALAGAQVAAVPFGFDEFERRRAAAVVRRRSALLSVAGSLAALGLVSIMALVTQSPPQMPGRASLPVVATQASLQVEAPALVNLDQFDLTTELEEHIAVLDAELSIARVEAVPSAQLRQLESTRQQLNASLQRVSYAHALLDL